MGIYEKSIGIVVILLIIRAGTHIRGFPHMVDILPAHAGNVAVLRHHFGTVAVIQIPSLEGISRAGRLIKHKIRRRPRQLLRAIFAMVDTAAKIVIHVDRLQGGIGAVFKRKIVVQLVSGIRRDPMRRGRGLAVCDLIRNIRY